MKSNVFHWTAVLAFCSGLQAQDIVFQQAAAIGAGAGMTFTGSASTITIPIRINPRLGGATVTGNPFSATEERHSLQVLGDGTRIEQTESTKVARDSQGRTRTEPVPQNNASPEIVTIQDPVAGVTWMLDPVRKTANKLPKPSVQIGKVLSGGPSGALSTGAISAAIAPADRVTVHSEPMRPAGGEITIRTAPGTSATTAAPLQEDLGTQNISGVAAKGMRSTITIPVGQIGNDRALQVVNEQWYSDDLGMLVKSTNSDPRFGTTDFELTNIDRAAPDPSLFQVPSDYSINEGKPQVLPGSPR